MPGRIYPLWAQALWGVLLISGLFLLTTGCDSTRTLGSTPQVPQGSPVPETLPPNPQNPPTDPPGLVTVVPYTRVICQPSQWGAMPFLETLLTNAPAGSLPATLSMKTQEGQEIGRIDRFQILSGNESSFNFVFSQARPENQQVDLYLGKMDLLYKKAEYQKLSTSPLILKASGRIFDADGIANFVAFSRNNESLLVPDLDKDRYVIRDTFGPHVLSIVELSPKEFINPVLSAEADVALFQKIEQGALRNYAYSLNSGEAIPFPKSPKTLTQFSPHIFRTGHMAWLEKTTDSLELKISTWNDLKKKNLIPLSWISTTDLVTLDFGARLDSMYLAKAIETYDISTQGRTLKRGYLEITEWELTHLIEKKTQVVEYPAEFYQRQLSGSESVVERVLFSPWTNQWVLSTSRGLSTFSNATMTWAFVGPQDGYLRCIHPTIGPEYHVEQVAK